MIVPGLSTSLRRDPPVSIGEAVQEAFRSAGPSGHFRGSWKIEGADSVERRHTVTGRSLHKSKRFVVPASTLVTATCLCSKPRFGRTIQVLIMAGEVEGEGCRVSWGVLVALLLLPLPSLCSLTAGKQLQVIKLFEGRVVRYNESKNFCYQRTYEPKWSDVWTKIQIRVNSTKMIRVTQVENEEKLKEMETFNMFDFFSSFLKEKLNDSFIYVDLYNNKTCIKVHVSDTDTYYSVALSRGFDPRLFFVFLCGLLLFFYGDTLSRSQIFYYSTGITVGMLASMLILVFMLSKLMPKKSPFVALLLGGWSVSIYVIQLVFKNLQAICTEYWQYLLGYLGIVGFVSFAFCYKYGPLENERSINILNWTLQLIGLLLMYISVQIRHIAVTMVVIAFCTKQIEYPVRWIYILYRKIKLKRGKPSPPRLLTEEEYRKQGDVETRKALEELRGYCSSPDFAAWKTVSRIQSPKRKSQAIKNYRRICA